MPELRRVKRLELSFKPAPWAFAEQRRSEIDAHFAKVREAKPAVWNGRVLLCRNPRAEDGVYRADYFETDFASFLAWRDWGHPDRSVFNSFGSGALRSVDGAFVLGRMNAHTANAGRIYFPAGTPDPNDIVAGRVDLGASVMREMAEEIGLEQSDYDVADGWSIIETKQVVACVRLLTTRHNAVELRHRIEAFLRKESLPELSEVMFVRSIEEFDAAMPEFIRSFLKDALAA